MGGFRVPLYRPGDDNISRLLLERGRIAADRAARSGEIWGNAIGNVGQIAAGAVQQHAEQKEASKRDQALATWLDSGEWTKDPQAAISGAVKILGPKLGPQLAEGLISFQRLQATKGQDALKLLPGLIGGVDALPEALRPAAYSAVRNGLLQAGVMRPEDTPEQYDPKQWPAISAYGKALKGEKPPGLIETSPGATLYDPETKQPVFTAPAKPAEPGNLQEVDLLVGGKAVKGTFEPKTGRYYYQGRPIEDPQKPPPPRDPLAQALAQSTLASRKADKLVKVEHKDQATGKTVIEWLPQSEVRGQEFEKGVGATSENRLAMADSVNQTGNDIIAKLSDPKVAATLGPAMGRMNTLRDFIGNPPPEFAELAGEIESYSLASMGVHGMRSVQGANQITKLLDAHHTPASLIATIKGLNSFSEKFMATEGRKSAASSGPKIGDKKTFPNGRVGVWDGQGWVAQ